ncbi:ATP-binding protein [Haloarcula amylovorans]|uniref:ATP-binding protein n=1 Tax=Haloarcula amylovorans TaxID=2562280 RepID=UPI001076348C|nr:ATP-binding protein [Halomicroarcula amylolytica]
MTPSLHVLYVGEAMSPIHAFKEHETDFTVCLAATHEDALARLGGTAFDCVVYAGEPGDRDMFLDGVVENLPTLPVVVYDGDCSNRSNCSNPPTDRCDRTVTDADTVPAAVAELVTESSPHLDSVSDDTGEELGYDYRDTPLWDNPEFMKSVLDNLLDAFFVFSVNREMVEWNTRLEEITGRSGKELAESDPMAFIAEEHREEAFESLASVLTEGHTTGEYDLVSVDGEHTPCEFVVSLVTENGEPRYICGIARDISDLRQKQAELERKQAELDQVVDELERSNAELEQFAYVASHDMKEPLRMVRNYLQLLEHRYSDELDEDATEFIGFAVDGARRLQGMIDQLLTYSRIDREGDPFRTVDCESVLATVQRNLEVAIEEAGADVESEPLPVVTGDSDQLVQLFQNLVSNAIKYNEEAPHIYVDATREGDVWQFTVEDDGIGIPEDQVDQVFDAFYGDASGVDEADSTGIGLAICDRIVQRHGGDIWVESTVGEGTAFHFTLPVEDAELEPESASLVEITNTNGSKAE